MKVRYGHPKRKRSRWDKPVTPKLCQMHGCERHQFQDSVCRRHLNPAKATTDPAAFFEMSAAQQRQTKAQGEG